MVGLGTTFSYRLLIHVCSAEVSLLYAASITGSFAVVDFLSGGKKVIFFPAFQIFNSDSRLRLRQGLTIVHERSFSSEEVSSEDSLLLSRDDIVQFYRSIHINTRVER